MKEDFVKRSDLVSIEEPKLGFEDFGGYEGVKSLVKESLIKPLKDPQKAFEFDVELPRGILLWGPPGTGKTTFASIIAKEAGLPLIKLPVENLISPWLGESGHRFSEAFRIIENASPAIVFVDEIDQFGKRDGGGTDGASQEMRRVFSQFLTWLASPERRSIIIGTTNTPEVIDDAMIRPGRFSALIPFFPPDPAARKQILEIHLGLQGSKRRPAMDEDSVRQVIEEVVKGSEFYSGAHLEELVRRAKYICFGGSDSALCGKHLLKALDEYKVDINSQKDRIISYMKLPSLFKDSLLALKSHASTEQIDQDRGGNHQS